VNELAHTLGDPSRQQHSVAVVVAAPRKDASAAVRQVAHMLQAAGSPIPVAGVAAVDPAGADQLRSGTVSKRVGGGDLVKSAHELAATLGAWWPHLLVADDAGGSAPGTAGPTGGGTPTAAGPSAWSGAAR
jgi:hypothetical protein